MRQTQAVRCAEFKRGGGASKLQTPREAQVCSTSDRPSAHEGSWEREAGTSLVNNVLGVIPSGRQRAMTERDDNRLSRPEEPEKCRLGRQQEWAPRTGKIAQERTVREAQRLEGEPAGCRALGSARGRAGRQGRGGQGPEIPYVILLQRETGTSVNRQMF